MEGELNSEEGLKKAETLFSKKFIEYLANKKSSTGFKFDKTNSRTLEPKDVTSFALSSDETTASESSRKSGKKKKKVKENPSRKALTFNFAFRNKLTQCSLIKDAEEVAPPEELKQLLVNMSVLLQELKPSIGGFENLYDLLSRITMLVTEFIRRPLKKIPDDKKTDHAKNLEKTTEAIIALLNDYKTEPGMDVDSGIRDFKRMEKEVIYKNHQIDALTKQLGEDQIQNSKVTDMAQRVKNSILKNDRLKAEIKFNQSYIKKYKKILLEKEWTKHKLENEILHMKKKKSKADLPDGDALDSQLSSPESSLTGENLQKIVTGYKIQNLRVKKLKEKPRKTVKQT